MTIKYVVAKNKCDVITADERFANDECLGQPLRAGLLNIRKCKTQLGPIPKKFLEPGEVLRGGDDQYFSDSCQHQARERIIYHRLLIYRNELFTHHPCDRIEPGPGAPGQYYSFH